MWLKCKSKIKLQMFKGMPNVVILKLEDNQIVNVNESAFKNLSSLKKFVWMLETTFKSKLNFRKNNKFTT